MARAIVGDYVIPIGLRCLDQKEMENYNFIDNFIPFYTS